MESLNPEQWRQAQRALDALASLSYRTGELTAYLQAIARSVSSLLNIHWSVVTLCQNGFEKLLASSLDLGPGEHLYALHGSLTETVLRTRRTLVVEDDQAHPEYGSPPQGYRSYLGVPLQTPQGEVIGTVCSFHQEPRPYTETEIHIVELFAERAATALDNYHLYQQQRQFNEVLEAEVASRTAELRATQGKLVERERLAAIGEFAASIVHEIRNPLTTVFMGLKAFQKLTLTPPFQERLSLALSEAARLEHLLSEILLYAKPQNLQLSEVHLDELVAEVLRLAHNMPEALGRQIKFSDFSRGAKVLGDKDKLKQVLLNIVRNACEAVTEGETITGTVVNPSPGDLCIQVHNGGEPIPPEVLPKLTQPFYTTKSAGTGLGLAIVKRIVDAHNGELVIQSSAAAGTTVSLKLPVI